MVFISGASSGWNVVKALNFGDVEGEVFGSGSLEGHSSNQ